MLKPMLSTDAEEAIGKVIPFLEINCYEIAANKLVAIPFVESPVWDDSTLGLMRGMYVKATVALILYDHFVIRYDEGLDRKLAADDQGIYLKHEREQFSEKELSRQFASSPWSKIDELEKDLKNEVDAAQKGDEAVRYRLRRNLNLVRLSLAKEIVSQKESFEFMQAVESQGGKLPFEASYALLMEVASSRRAGPLLATQTRLLIEAVWGLTKPELRQRGYRAPKVIRQQYYDPDLNRHSV